MKNIMGASMLICDLAISPQSFTHPPLPPCPLIVCTLPQVRELANYLLGDALASKAPMLAYNHFVESLFVLNDCQAASRAGRTLAPGGGGGSELMSISGGAMHLAGASPAMRAKRDVVYHTLLKRMAPEHKFSTQAKLVSEVDTGSSSGSYSLLHIALQIMIHSIASTVSRCWAVLPMGPLPLTSAPRS